MPHGEGGDLRKLAGRAGDHPEIDPPTLPFAAVTEPLRLLEPGHAEALIATIREAWPPECPPVALVVLDTLSRALAGGDENDSVVMGTLVAMIDRIRNETGVAVLAIYHSGKDASRGARGHSLLHAAGDDRAAVVTKQRDLASGQRIGFRLRMVELGHDLAGEPVTSCVVDRAEASLPSATLSPAEGALLEVLHDLIAREGTSLPAGPGWPDAADLRGVQESRLRAECDSRRACSPAPEPKSRARAYQRALRGLQAKHRIAIRDGILWSVRPAPPSPWQATRDTP